MDTDKVWQRPLLTVLVRSQSAESILAACKREGFNKGPTDTNLDCEVLGGECNTCFEQIPS